MTEIQLKQRELFGGAVTINIPENFVDVSDIRQVPDNQEVFIDPGSDLSLVIEILQRVEKEDDKEAIEFHFSALADDNSASSSRIFEILPQNDSQVQKQHTTRISKPIILRGEQEVSKFNTSSLDKVSISLALFRVGFKNVDIVMSVNTPAMGQLETHKASLIFSNAASSFSVRDFNLFA